MDNVRSTQNKLLEEVKKEGEKFGDDVKFLAEFTAGIKKFDPWIQKAEAKRAVGMLKPKNLQEALDQLEDAKVPTSKQCTCSMRLVNLNRLDSIEKLDAHAFDSFARITKSYEQYFVFGESCQEKKLQTVN